MFRVTRFVSWPPMVTRERISDETTETFTLKVKREAWIRSFPATLCFHEAVWVTAGVTSTPQSAVCAAQCATPAGEEVRTQQQRAQFKNNKQNIDDREISVKDGCPI